MQKAIDNNLETDDYKDNYFFRDSDNLFWISCVQRSQFYVAKSEHREKKQSQNDQFKNDRYLTEFMAPMKILLTAIDSGYFVDRLRPRGIKEKARVDLWRKEIDPINDLREWFGHDPRRRSEFKKRYFMELNNKKESQSRSLSEGKRRRCSATLLCQR